jgi:uncharacterized protein (DUF488 family)
MVGHSNHDWGQFEKLLRKHGVTKLVDVRSVPRSRFPQFCEGALKRALPPGAYLHLPELGGHQMFEARHVRRALQQLLDGAKEDDRLCLMCSEGDFRQCHRHSSLTPVVIELGWKVLQIMKDGSVIEDLGPAPLFTPRP